jgi:hypothetical protein
MPALNNFSVRHWKVLAFLAFFRSAFPWWGRPLTVKKTSWKFRNIFMKAQTLSYISLNFSILSYIYIFLNIHLYRAFGSNCRILFLQCKVVCDCMLITGEAYMKIRAPSCRAGSIHTNFNLYVTKFAAIDWSFKKNWTYLLTICILQTQGNPNVIICKALKLSFGAMKLIFRIIGTPALDSAYNVSVQYNNT